VSRVNPSRDMCRRDDLEAAPCTCHDKSKLFNQPEKFRYFLTAMFASHSLSSWLWLGKGNDIVILAECQPTAIRYVKTLMNRHLQDGDNKMSEYEKSVRGTNKRGRKPLPIKEKERRIKIQQLANRMRQEARRRAALVLQHRYSDEFLKLYSDEFTALKKKTNA